MIPSLVFLFWASLGLLLLALGFMLQMLGPWWAWRKVSAKGMLVEDCSLMIVGRHDAEGFTRWIHAAYAAFPAMEIIAVDNQSEDDTANVLESLKRQYPLLVVVTIPVSERFWGTRKLALTLAVKAAHGRYSMWVDTACALPEDMTQWQKRLTAPFRHGKTVATFAPVKVADSATLGTKMNVFGQNAWAVTRTISFFLTPSKGIPTGMIPVNFAFETAKFFDIKGYVTNMHLDGGEAEFLLADLAELGPVIPVVHPDAMLERPWLFRHDSKMNAHRRSWERLSLTRHGWVLFLADLAVLVAVLHWGLLLMAVQDPEGATQQYPVAVGFHIAQCQALIGFYILVQLLFMANAWAWSKRLGMGAIGLLSPFWLRAILLSRALTFWKR
ncbi:MAG: hypothetical protein ABR98_06295 [Cryomorphaceae bacterium BACL7 MAG-120910-bin2]|jgi:hypothetical protein|nr:MAG: hypothetical protein ABR98_06295 [Cryomorphaceae bacterium BACL7 MAG-120910-bin2]KRO66797.1 MAG: hypothetical protein ABR84_00320 [Cryomorphaceae bacterium BACL21 MAG-121220-bin10]KRO68849.1 MAG: hypothetical protein ABR88_03660 [Cryomorphaceae bacterium BACL7 MAG-120322-bin74]NQW25238.1 glycosyltransferase [Cryomorphaceae bacterium]